MNIALIGYGRIAKEIEKIAISRNHTIGLKIDKDNLGDFNSENLEKVDVAIEFSVPDQAYNNISRCLKEGVPVVSGTTGWVDKIDDAIKLCESGKTAFLYASNFSIGVNVLFHMNQQLSKLMDQYSDYNVELSEVHHTKKLDAPSGTAITLANGIIKSHSDYKKWVDSNNPGRNEFRIDSERVGDVPGTHKVTWKSSVDRISLEHEAFGREGFALGAVIAAEFVKGKTGFLSMKDLLGF